MNQISTTTVTMSSIELVDYINSQRKEGEAELRHDHFMVKVPKVLGEAAPKFLGTDFYINGTGAKVERPVYRFPKREACLMAMSYSYDLQAKVFDRMTALEDQVKQVGKSATTALPYKTVAESATQGFRLAKLFGFRGNQAILFADKTARTVTGLSPLEIGGATHLIADPRGLTYTPTDLGKMRNPPISAVKMNQLLESRGFQTRVNDVWTPTEKAEGHYEWLDTNKRHADGTPVKQWKWFASIDEALQCETADQ